MAAANLQHPGGYSRHNCKECKEKKSQRAKEYALANIELKRAKGRAYSSQNKKRKSNYDAIYRSENKDRIKEVQKKYYEENKEKFVAYRQNNIEKMRAYKRERYRDGIDIPKRRAKSSRQKAKDREYYQNNKAYVSVTVKNYAKSLDSLVTNPRIGRYTSEEIVVISDASISTKEKAVILQRNPKAIAAKLMRLRKAGVLT